jgi:serine/threonine-protein kinase SRPK3
MKEYYDSLGTSDYNSESRTSSSENISSESISTTEKQIYLSGEIIKNYNIIYEIGSGAFSTVWLAFDINDNNYYAIKVQNSEDYEDGKDEIQILKKIGDSNEYINSLKSYFIESLFVESSIEKFPCSVFELCAGNLYTLGKKGKYKNGYPSSIVKRVFKQICLGVQKLHNEDKLFHGDIKPDNILVCGTNNKDKKCMDLYTQNDFNNLYSRIKKEYWIKKGKNIKNIKKMPTETKLKIRKKIHQSIINNIISNSDFKKESKNYMDERYYDNIKIKLTDFGHYCPDDEIMDEDFGTTYYRAPEIILMGDCRKPVDIWALGCTLYELLTGEILFDPDDSDNKEEYNHLKLIIELCGNFKLDYLKTTKYYKDYFDKDGKLKDFNISEIKDIKEQLHKKLKNKEIDDLNECIDLLSKMIKLSFRQRVVIDEILAHRWLESKS